MIEIRDNDYYYVGPSGAVLINKNDEIAKRLLMICEGEGDGLSVTKISKKYQISRQRYYQLLQKYKAGGAESLKSQKTGPKSKSVLTDEITRQVIRYKFLDPETTSTVIAQKIKQTGQKISIRSVERIISTFGLQKKTLYVASGKKTEND